MDMSAAYWAAVSENLPSAAIVFDRFHITQLVNQKLDDLRRELVREATGLMKQTVKGVRYLLLMRRDNIEEEKLPRLDEALKHNEPLFTGYLLKEALGLLWEQPSYAKMNALPPRVVRARRPIWNPPDDAVGQDSPQSQERHSVRVEAADQQRPNGRYQ
jgi:transposase